MAPNNRGWEEIKVAVALTVIAAIAVVMRFVARFTRKLKLEIDDWLAIASLIFIGAMLIELILWACIGSSGKHFATLTPPEMEKFFKIFLANEFTYSITSPLVKLTLLFFYRRLFSVRKFRIAADVLSTICVLWGIATIIVSGAQCSPLPHYWNIMIPGKCINQIAFVEAIQGINIFFDFAILILPMPMVWGLQRPWQDKLALSGVFLLGIFVCVASIVRLYALTQINVMDISYTTYEGMLWTFVEPCIGLVCCCLPIIRGLFPAYNSKGTSKRYGGGYGQGGSGRRAPFSNNHSSHAANAQYYEMDESRSTSRNGDGDVDSLVKSGDGGYGRNDIRVRTTVEVV